MHARFEKLAVIAEKGKIKWQTIHPRTRRTIMLTLAAFALLTVIGLAFRRKSAAWRSNVPSWMGSMAAHGSATASPTAGTPAPIGLSKFEVWDADSGRLLHLPSAFGAGERDLAGLNQTADDHELRIGFLEQQIAERLAQQAG